MPPEAVLLQQSTHVFGAAQLCMDSCSARAKQTNHDTRKLILVLTYVTAASNAGCRHSLPYKAVSIDSLFVKLQPMCKGIG
jgi:hypothetical protein